MRKKSLLTKVVALGAMTTLLASTTAFAATYSTRTIYLTGAPNYVYVTTTVDGLTTGDEVTYLAGDTNEPIYINQYTVETADGTTKSFSYKTTKAKNGVVGATVKMAKADSTFSNSETITTGDSALPETDKFTFTVNVDGKEKTKVSFEAADIVGAPSVNLGNIDLGGRVFDSAKIGETTLVAKVGTDIVVTLPDNFVTLNTANELSSKEDTIEITTKPALAPTVTYSSGVKARNYEFTYTDTEGEKKITGPMFAIYGTVAGDGVTECGIAVSDTGDPKTAASGVEYYAASVTNGDFGVAIVDDANTSKTTAYVRTYYKVGTTVTYGEDYKVIDLSK